MAIIIATAILMIILLVVSFISVPPMRIFSEFEPLEEGKLRTRLVEMCDKYGMTIKKIFVMYTGMRINKSNALCTGVGKKRTILLDYNLINKYEIDEIVALFVREFAHVKFRHTAKSLSFKILRILIIITGFKLVLDYPALYSEFGFTEVNYLWAQMVLMFCIWPLSKGLDAVSNYISRKHEYQADTFAAKEGYGEKLISSLKRLEKESLSDVNPHPLKVLLNYSHPTLSQRISAIENVD
jgi:STE24 endopeptidase